MPLRVDYRIDTPPVAKRGVNRVPTPKEDRLGSIDALRGVAALGVAWFHVYTQNGGWLVSAAVPHLINVASVWGRWGVQLFFVISGFVVAFTLFDRTDVLTPSAVLRYLLRRSVRLDPTYWTAMCLSLLLTSVFAWLSRAQIGEVLPLFCFCIEQVTRNVIYFLPLNDPFYLPVAWTLAIEVHFYILFSCMLVVVNRAHCSWNMHRDISTALIIFLFLLAWVLARTGILPVRDYWLLWHLGGFIIGISAALAYKGVRHANFLLIVSLVTIGTVYGVRRESDVLATLLSGVTVVSVVFSRALGRLVERRSLLVFGQLSYCIYLLHQTFGGLTVKVLQAFVSRVPGLQQLLFVIIGMVVTVLAASVLHRVVEHPSIKLSRRIGATSTVASRSTRGRLTL